jgi:hypothetical protein
MKKDIYLVDYGFLLNETDDDFNDYNTVYDKKYGFYDLDQYLITKDKIEENIKELKDIFKSKQYNTAYCVITYQGKIEFENEEELREMDFLSFVDYSSENIIYSLKKENGKFEENFIK